MLSQLSYLLDVNSTERKMFESLIIQVKNFLTQYDTKQDNHGNKKFRAKNIPAWNEKLDKENHEPSKMIGEKIFQPREKQEKKSVV